jgi:hypothetical protein
MEQWRQATMLALLSFKAGQGTLQRKKDVATVAKKKEQHTRCAQLRIRRKLARTREPHRLQEREEAKHDGHATQAATKAATMAGAEAKEIVPAVCVSAVVTPPSPPSPERARAEVVQPESNNEEKKKEVKEGKAELTMMPGQQKATSPVVGVPLSLHEAEIVTESEKDDEKKKKKKKKKTKKTPSKTAERREADSGQKTCRQMLADIDRKRGPSAWGEVDATLLQHQKILHRWCAEHPEALDEPWEEQFRFIPVHWIELAQKELEKNKPRRSNRLQTAPRGV